MSSDDFSNSDVDDPIDEMFDYNNDGQLDSGERANENAYYANGGSFPKDIVNDRSAELPYKILMFFIFIYATVAGIDNIMDHFSEERERDRERARQEEEFRDAQTVNYFYDDGTESDEENSYDDKYQIMDEKPIEWQ